MTSQYTEFYLGANSKVAQIETIEISHPDMSKTYWVVRNIKRAFTATLEDGSTEQEFEYYPIKIDKKSIRQNLDQGLSITFGDIGKTLSQELKLIYDADGFEVKPTLKFRTWRSDYLSVPLYGPIRLEIKYITVGREGATFDAISPSLNGRKSGLIYRIDDIPMLRGVLK